VKTAFSFAVDTSAFANLATDLDALAPEVLLRVCADSANAAAEIARADAMTDILSAFNLARPYVAGKLVFTPAKPDGVKPTARVAAPIRGTLLTHFDAQQASTPVTWSNDRILGMGKKFSKWPGWTERKGDAKRGIARDYKAAGMQVQVKRGRTSESGHWFTASLKRGGAAGGNVGVFYRAAGAERAEIRYGPSVYSLFRVNLDENTDRIADTLTLAISKNLDTAIAKVAV